MYEASILPISDFPYSFQGLCIISYLSVWYRVYFFYNFCVKLNLKFVYISAILYLTSFTLISILHKLIKKDCHAERGSTVL